MKSNYFRTSELARAAGIHPNTVRLYEKWGLIPPVERSPSGYRRFTSFHLDCLLLARMIYEGDYPGTLIRRSGVQVLLRAVSGDLGGAIEMAYQHKALVQAERAQAEAAVSLLERWANGATVDNTGRQLHIGETAVRLGVTIDMLRNWERNGLIEVPRNSINGYRLYGPEQIGRLRVIRMLSRAGYSQMAILRMVLQLDSGQTEGLRQALDTPGPDEDVFSASDRLLTTLTLQENQAEAIIAYLEEMIQKSKFG